MNSRKCPETALSYWDIQTKKLIDQALRLGFRAWTTSSSLNYIQFDFILVGLLRHELDYWVLSDPIDSINNIKIEIYQPKSELPRIWVPDIIDLVRSDLVRKILEL